MPEDDNNFQVYCSPGILDFLAEVLDPIEEDTMSNYDRKFINGQYAGTRVEIARSKAATKLPNGTPIVEYNYDEAELSPAQVAHRLGNINVHEPQQFILEDNGRFYSHTGPSVAQEWKILARGERPFYRFDGEVSR